jgi:ribose/xylose/arabinose/galactoside ABC-type transport system permease subunit
VLTRGDSIVNLPAYFRWFNDGIFLGMPVPIVATLVVFVVTWVLLYHTKLAATHSRLAAIGKR